MAPPLVSVVIPTYNRLPLLREAVASVRAQTYPHWELIVVDDGSTDGTAEYVRGIGDPRVRLVDLPHTGNVSRVRNAGARTARGDYLAFLDSDDLWTAGKLSVQVERTRQAGVRWSYTRYGMIDEAGAPVPLRSGSWAEVSGWIALPLINFECAVCPCSLLIEPDLFESVGAFDESIGPREDYELTLRLAVAAETLAIPESLVIVRDHPGRSAYITPDPFEHAVAMFDAVYRRTGEPAMRAALRRQLAYHCIEASASRFARRDVTGGLRFLARAATLRASPRDIAWAPYRGLRWALTGGRPGHPSSLSPRTTPAIAAPRTAAHDR